MVDPPSGPPLSVYVQQQIEEEQRKIHDAYHEKLAEFRIPTKKILGVEKSNLPLVKGPELGYILGRYASELFKAEAKTYPNDPQLETWLGRLLLKVHDAVESKAESVENISYHASHGAIVTVIAMALVDEKRHALDERKAVVSRTFTEPKSPQALSESRKAFIQPILDKKGWSPSQWADRTGVDPSVVYDYLNGRSRPRPRTRKELAEALGVDARNLPE
jgi:ribosome-binding protein aMBF1 (putative translation factor)